MIVRILSSSALPFLLLILSIPITVSISNILPQQQAKAQNVSTTTTNSTTSTQEPKNASLTYTNSTYGIKIQYPSDWTYKGSNSSKIIVGFIPKKSLFGNTPVGLTIGVLKLPLILLSVHNVPLSAFAPSIINGIRQSTPGFQLVESNATTIGPAGVIPAYKIVYTTGGHKIMEIITIKGDKAYLITYVIRQTAQYSSYLPIAQKMIDSFQIVNAKPTTSSPSAVTTVNATKPTASPSTVPNSIVASTSNTTSQKEIAEFKDARERYLLAWNHTGFHSQFDTYINSTQGYGVYQEHKSSTFKPGEPIILYVEPVGFTHMPIKVGANNTKLYLVNLTAGIVLSDRQGNVLLGKENIPLLNIVSHNKNTEVSMRLRVTQSSPFPVGDYVITYTINDVPSGKSFKIVKNISIAGGSGIDTNKTSTLIQQSSPPPSPNNSSTVPSSWHSYTNSTYGIALRYPPNWILSPVSQPHGTNNTTFEIMDFAPPISQDPNATTIIGVGIDNITRKVTPTLEQYLRDEINIYRSAANVTDFKVIKVGTNVTVGGHPGYLLYYKEKLRTEPTSRTYLEAGTIAENTIYYLSINSAVSDKQFTTVLLPQVMHMIKSFQILQPTSALNQQQQATPEQTQSPGNILGFG